LHFTVDWTMNLFTFCPAAIHELSSDQCLLFEGTTCRLVWRTKSAYRVKLFLNGEFYNGYKPNAIAELPVQGSFRVELIAQSIYGDARQSVSLAVNHVHFKEAGKFALNAAAETRPRTHKSLQVLMAAMQPVTPAPVFQPIPVSLGSTLLVASREDLEQEIIANSYQPETNFQ
jgi:hypothetical protein